MNRRNFLALSIKVFFSALFAVFAALAFSFLYPSRIRKKTLHFIEVLNEDNLPRRGVKTVVFSYKRKRRTINSRAFVVRHKDRLFALSPVCSHLGCLVNWHRSKEKFLCPCHGGKYDIEGKVIGGPPPAPLTRLPLRVRKGKAYIGLRI